ncbi:helix-turn-helix transcriptional regulator [Streptomyces sp. P8-A8]
MAPRTPARDVRGRYQPARLKACAEPVSTDYQQARAALGARLRELRATCPGGPLTGAELAARLGWTQSKISKLENGRQTASPEDLKLWAVATGFPDVHDELHARLRGFESHVRSWRRQLASGHRPVQDTWNELVAGATTINEWEPTQVSGALRTADYAPTSSSGARSFRTRPGHGRSCPLPNETTGVAVPPGQAASTHSVVFAPLWDDLNQRRGPGERGIESLASPCERVRSRPTTRPCPTLVRADSRTQICIGRFPRPSP